MKKKHTQTNRKTWQRVTSVAAALTLSVGFLPMDAAKVMATEINTAAEQASLQFPAELIEAVQEYGGDKYDAEAVLYSLYKQGVIDKNGDVLPVESYNIDGQSVTEVELRAMIALHTADETVVAEGELLTWGDIALLLTYKDYLAALGEAAKGIKNGEIDPNDPTRSALTKNLQSDLTSRLAMDGKNLVLRKPDSTPKVYLPRIDDEMTAKSDRSLVIDRKMPIFRIDLNTVSYKPTPITMIAYMKLSNSWAMSECEAQMDKDGKFTVNSTLDNASKDRTSKVYFKIRPVDGLGAIKLLSADNESVNAEEGWITVGKNTKLNFQSAAGDCYREFDLELYSPDVKINSVGSESYDSFNNFATLRMEVCSSTNARYLWGETENQAFGADGETIVPAYVWGTSTRNSNPKAEPNTIIPEYYIHDGIRVRFEAGGYFYDLNPSEGTADIYEGGLYDDHDTPESSFTVVGSEEPQENVFRFRNTSDSTDEIVLDLTNNTMTRGSDDPITLVLHPQSTIMINNCECIGFPEGNHALQPDATIYGPYAYYLCSTRGDECRVQYKDEYLINQSFSGDLFVDTIQYDGEYVIVKMRENCSLNLGYREILTTGVQAATMSSLADEFTYPLDREKLQETLNESLPHPSFFYLNIEDTNGKTQSIEAHSGKDWGKHEYHYDYDVEQATILSAEDGCQYLRFKVGKDQQFKLKSITCVEDSSLITSDLAGNCSYQQKSGLNYQPYAADQALMWYPYDDPYTTLDISSFNEEDSLGNIGYFPSVKHDDKPIYDTTTLDTIEEYLLDLSSSSKSFVNEKKQFVWNADTQTMKEVSSGNYMDGTLIEYRVPLATTTSSSGEKNLTLEAKQWIMSQVTVTDEAYHVTDYKYYVPTMYVDDCTNMLDPKVYCHYMLEPSGTPSDVDYIYFYVETNTAEADYSSNAFLHAVFNSNASDQDYSTAEYALPRVEYALPYSFSASIPFYYAMDKLSNTKTVNFGFGDVYYSPNSSYDTLMNRSSQMTDWAKERLYLYYNPLYRIPLTSYDNLHNTNVFDTYKVQTADNNNMEDGSSYGASVPQDATVNLRQIGLNYSADWLNRSDSLGGSVNGVPMHYWSKSTMEAANDARNQAGEQTYNAWQYFDLFRTAPYTNYYSTFESDHDVYSIPSIKEVDRADRFSIDKLTYQKAITEANGDYPLTLGYEYSLGKTEYVNVTSTDTLPWYNGSTSASYSRNMTRGTGYESDSVFTWTAEFTEKNTGKKTIIQPDTADSAVEFTVNQYNVVQILDFSDCMEGEIRFRLRIANSPTARTADTKTKQDALVEGKDYVILTSEAIMLSATSETYLLVPSASKQIQAYQNDTASVLFSSNIARRNEALYGVSETEFRIQLFAVDADGNRTSNVPVYEATDIGTYQNTLTSFQIPENVLSKISPEDGFSYEAVISTTLEESKGSKQEFSDSAMIHVVECPVKFVFGDINGFNLNSSSLNVKYHVEDATKDFNGKYTVVRKSDNLTVLSGDLPTDAATGYEKTITIPASVLTIPNDSLKDYFSINLEGSNSENGTLSIASAIAAVYNDGSMKIEIGNRTVGDGDEYTLSKRPFIENNMSSDGHTVALSGDVTMAKLQEEMRLVDDVSIATKNGKFGTISDVIKWDYEDTRDAGKGEKESNLYYKLFGENNALGDDGQLLIPDLHLALMGGGDGSGIITAMHSNTGMTTEVDVTIDDVENQLYLFQFSPAITTKLTYTDGNGDTHTFETNNKGQIAIYEENGFESGSVLQAYSENGKYFYKNSFETDNFKSGAGNAAKDELYAVNLCKLKRGYTVFVTIPEAKNKTVTLRGGAYKYAKTDKYGRIDLKNSTYAAAADLLTAKDTPDDGDGVSNGLDGVKFTADKNGSFTVYFNSKQMFSQEENEETIPVMFAFEAEMDGYYKRPFEITKDFGEITLHMDSKVSALQIGKMPGQPKINYLPQQIYYSNSKRVSDLSDDVEYIGRTANSEDVCLLVTSTFEDFKGQIEKDSNGYSQITSDTDAHVRYVNRATRKEIGSETNMQSDSCYVYPFSTVMNNFLVMTVNKDKLSWLEDKHYAQMSLQGLISGKPADKQDVTYNLLNGEIVDDMDPDDIKELQDTLKDELTEMDVSPLGMLNQDGLAGQAATAFSSTLLTVLNNDRFPVKMKLNCVVLPTADPTSFEILMGINAMDEFLQDSEVDGFATAEARASFLNKKATASASNEGSGAETETDPSLAGYLKEGAKIDADQFNDFVNDKLKERNKKKAEKEGKKTEEDSDPQVTIMPTLYGIMEAKYDLVKKTWDYSYKGFNLGVEVEAKKEIMKENMIVGPGIPIYVEINGTLGASINMGQKYITVDETALTKDGIGEYKRQDREGIFLTRLGVKFGLSVFAGLGHDNDLIGIVFGFEVEGGLSLDFALLIGLIGDDNTQFGVQAGIDLTLACKFKAHALMFTYEATLFEVGASASIGHEQHEHIQELWSNAGKKQGRPQVYNPRADQLQSMQINSADEKGLQIELNTVSENVPGLRTLARPNDNLFALDTASIESIQYSDDGKMIIFLDDNVASYADGSGVVGGSIVPADDDILGVNGGDSNPLPEDGTGMSDDEKALIDSNPEAAAEGETVKNFGDYYAALSGSDGVYFAAWTQQRNETTKEKYDTADVNLDDLAIAMNSTETIVSVYSEGEWTTQKLTNNFQPDMTPSIAGANGRAVVVWKTSYSTNAEDPLAANNTDTLVYSIYNGALWSDAATLYDGSFGGISSYDTAILDDGTMLVTYTVQTSSSSTEVFYSIIDKDGTISVPTRLTMNDTSEINLQVVTAGEQFVLGWFDTEEKDIMLMSIQADGTFDTMFPERVSKTGYTAAMSDVFTLCGGEALTDFSVFWSSQQIIMKEDEEYAGQTDHIETSVYGAKLYSYEYTLEDGVTVQTIKGMTPPQFVKKLDDSSATVSELSAFYSGDDEIKVLLNETKFVAEDISVTVEAAAQMLVSRFNYNTDEDYEVALEAKITELEGNSIDGYVTVTTAKAKAIYDSENYTFKEILTLDNAEYDENAVIPNLDAMILLSLTNDGITPITKVNVNETAEVPLEAPLLPGETVTIPYTYTVGEKVRDIDFHITADNTDDENAAAEGTLILDAPKIEVLGYDLQASEGVRTLNLQLNNSVAIPLASSEKKLVVRVYADQEKKEVIEEVVVSDTDLLTNIDDGMGNVEIPMSVEDIMEHTNISEDEIPAQGIPMYVEATVESAEGEIFSSIERTVVAKSMRTDKNTPFGIEAITEFGEDSITVSSVITNESLQEQYLCNVNIILYDAEGNIIAEKNTSNDTTDPDTFIGEQTLADEKYNVTFTVGEDLTAEQFADVAYAEAGAYGDTMYITFDMGIADDAEPLDDAEIALGTTMEEPETPVSEWGEFAGWYTDEALTEAYDFSKKVCRNFTLHAKWTAPNLDASAEGCFVGTDGNALTYDADTRTLLTADGKNPTVNASALSVDLSKIQVLDEDGNAITGSDSTWFTAEWLDKDGETVETPEDAGDYTLKISPTEAGEAGGANGTLVIHVTVDPYQLSVKGVVPELRSYDGTYDVKLDCTAAELVPPTEEGFFRGDDVQLEIDDSVIGTADKLVGSTTVSFTAKLTGADAANYTLGESATALTTITPKTLELEWGTMDGDTFKAGVDNVMLDESGKASICAIPTNLLEGDDVKITLANDSTTTAYQTLTTKTAKLEGEDAAKYQLARIESCTWQATSNKFTMDGATLTLNGNIGVNYYTYIPKTLLADSKAYVMFTTDKGTEKIRLSSLTPETDGRYKLTYSVAVKEMMDDIVLQVRTGDNGIVPLVYSSGKAVPNNTFTYSVADYLNTVQNDTTGTYSVDLHALTTALQDFGSCTQDYFGYNTENRFPVSDSVANVTADQLDDYQLTQSGSNGNQFKLKSASLVLESDTALRLFFTGDAAMIANWTVTVDGQKLPIQQRGDMYFVEMQNIGAADLDKSYSFEFVNGSFTYTVTYSPLAYAASVLKNYSRDTKLANVARALYLYSKAAERYFG